jgi:hypothetical protein
MLLKGGFCVRFNRQAMQLLAFTEIIAQKQENMFLNWFSDSESDPP